MLHDPALVSGAAGASAGTGPTLTPTSGRDRSDAMTSLTQGLRILAHVQEHGPVRARDLGAALDVPTSTVYRYLATLVESGYLIRVDGQVLPSDRLAGRDAPSHHLVELASGTLRALRRETGLSALLTVRVHTVGVCLESVVATPSHRLHLGRGQVHPLYAGASMTPLLAHAPTEVVESVLHGPLRRFTAATPDAETIRHGLPRVREQGYALSFGEITPGMGALGLGVVVGGRCVCALSLVGEAVSVTDLERLLPRLRAAGTALEAVLSRPGAQEAWGPGGGGHV